MKTLLNIFVSCIIFLNYAIGQTVNCTTSFIESNWVQLGPFEYPEDNQMGRVVSLWVDPENNDHILAGTRASSLWESTDGGTNWHNVLSYIIPACGVWDIVNFDEGLENSIYLSTMYWASDLNIYNLGLVYYDIDVDQWKQIENYPVYGAAYDDKYDFKRELKLDRVGSRKLFAQPESTNLWVLNGENIFIWGMNTEEWSGDLPILNLDDSGNELDGNHSINEVGFVPSSSNQAIVVPNSGLDGDVLYTDEADEVSPSWTSLPTPYTGLFTLVDDDYYEMSCTVSVPSSEVAYVYANFQVISGGGVTHYGRLYEYALPVVGGFAEPYLVRYLDVPDDPYTTWGKFDNLVVIPENIEEFILGDSGGPIYRGTIPDYPIDIIDIHFVSSTNPGTLATTTHTDIRDLQYLYNTTTDKSIVYIATDGGLSMCGDINVLTYDSYNTSNWINLNGYGLTITEFLGFDNSDMDEYQIFAASPDGNSFIFGDQSEDVEPFFTNYHGGDGYDGAISEVQYPKAVYNYNSSGARDPSSFSLVNTDNPGAYVPGILVVPKSEQGCTDCLACPENCAEHNFSTKPMNFEYNFNDEYFWTGTSDLFRDPEAFDAAYSWIPMSKTYISLEELGKLADPSVITYRPITAYKEYISDKENEIITMYYSIKENRVTDANPLEVGVNEIKLVRSTMQDVPGIDDLFEANDITPELNELGVGYYNQIDESIITDIEIDESNPEHLWISFGFNTLGEDREQVVRYILSNEHNAKNGRVYFSPDGGETWQNTSTGLPDYPILCLEYWQGTNDIIFAGTDVGVYVWNSSLNIWQCYDTFDDLPYCSVNELEINYCTNTLRASTFGYGLWESQLPEQETLEVIDDMIWDQNLDFNRSISIKPGATLFIQDCEINMPKGSRIIVENGGKLIVDNATITNHCDFWKGIEVWGSGNTVSHPALADIITGVYPISASDHGVVYLLNNAKIESAEVAIATYNSSSPTSSSYNGGIIVAHDAEFHNNIVSIDMHPFDVSPSNTDDDNVSEFLMCTFKKDEQMSCGTYASSDVFLNDVDGVLFHACRFENTFSSCTDFNYPIGINSTNATYTVENDCGFIAEAGCEEYETYFQATIEEYMRQIQQLDRGQ